MVRSPKKFAFGPWTASRAPGRSITSSFLAAPQGFPPSDHDLETLTDMTRQIGSAFRTRLLVADFARLRDGRWCLIEAGPGSWP